jgi:hypothetical protein
VKIERIKKSEKKERMAWRTGEGTARGVVAEDGRGKAQRL